MLIAQYLHPMKGYLARIEVDGEEVGEDFDLDSIDQFYAEEPGGRRYRIELTDAPKGVLSVWRWSVH
ncbi:hypothetical protein [Humibacter soli]